MSDEELRLLEQHPACYDEMLVILIREILSFERLNEIAQRQSVQVLRTRRGNILRLQGRSRHRITVELNYSQTPIPTIYLFKISDFREWRAPLAAGGTEAFIDLTDQ